MPPVMSSKNSASLDMLREKLAAMEQFNDLGKQKASGHEVAIEEKQEFKQGHRRCLGHQIEAVNGSPVPSIPFGIAALDEHLPWGGLPQAALHEIVAASEPAAAGFSAVLLSRLVQATKRAVVWCRRPARGFRPTLYGAGLARFGLASDALIIAQDTDRQAILWTMEECLKSRAVAAVLGEVDRIDGRALRRLQLAAEKTGVMALLLRPGNASLIPGPMVTRWQVSTASSPWQNRQDGAAWQVALLKCRGGGAPGTWDLAWNACQGLFEHPK